MILKGKVAVVTGGARGLGRAIAQRLAADGAAVAVWDLDGTGAQVTVDGIAAARGRGIALTANAADADSIAAASEETQRRLGAVSILVNNAARSPFVRFDDLDAAIWDDLMAVNLRGPFLCCKAMLPAMVAAGWGRIVNISSSSAQTGSAAQTHYAASKAGVVGFTKSLAIEYATRGVTVNAVAPGFVDTEGLREAPVDIAGFAPKTPMQRPGKPENIAAAVAYLASPDADYVTGQTLGVNGGRYCN